MPTVNGNQRESSAVAVKTNARGKRQPYKAAPYADETSWDDTELLDDWNAAHAEYMKYHSIAAQEKAKREAATKDTAVTKSNADASAPTEETVDESVSQQQQTSSTKQAATSKAETTVRAELFQPLEC
ncbi:hypothetical protein AMS68_002919 [Peltaster fructicola]|uniref:Survival motor neuron Tudor domain-containing protein n=1 Tax=Peltaster fructicola TaxID=286661 RepID=A0A6H0XRL3_9PEZI|nr:hypothetical protein AMS68_002919 [Peltaster fructicola]